MSHINTALIHQGRESATKSLSVNPPLVRASTTVFSDLSAFKASYSGKTFETARYGRTGTSTTFDFQSAMAAISHTESCIATSCGLSACTAVISAFASSKKKIILQRNIYGPVTTFAENELKKRGVHIEYFESTQELERIITPNTTLIFIEIPTSLTMKLLDVSAVANIASKHSIPLACDATWGTPLFFDAHQLGINITIHAVTKYINGHSDVMLGAITGTYAALEKVRIFSERHGNFAAPDSCWLALRGLRTLSVRLARHQENSLFVANFLQNQLQVKDVFFPALPTSPYYDLWRKQFSGAAGPFTIELVSCSEVQFENFINSLELFSLGTSWGGFESLVMPAIAHDLRGKYVLPNDNRLVRLHIGLEDKLDLCDDLANALNMLTDEKDI